MRIRMVIGAAVLSGSIADLSHAANLVKTATSVPVPR
jgi:hypothetical protein